MKSKFLFLKVLTTVSLLTTNCFASDKLITCPSINQLKKIRGFSIEYPINLDVMTKEPMTWLVAQNKINLQTNLFQTLIISPVKPEQDEYPNDAAARMIEGFQALTSQPECDDNIMDGKALCACAYWNPIDGSFASYFASEYEKNNAFSLAKQLKMSANMMAQFKAMQQ